MSFSIDGKPVNFICLKCGSKEARFGSVTLDGNGRLSVSSAVCQTCGAKFTTEMVLKADGGWTLDCKLAQPG